jgi:hypothetical protein
MEEMVEEVVEEEQSLLMLPVLVMLPTLIKRRSCRVT